MTVGRGHATEAELKFIEELERTYDPNWPADQVVDLAQLYLDPLHEEDRGLGLLNEVLSQDPSNQRARYWLSVYLIRYDLSDEAIREGRAIARELQGLTYPWNAAGYDMEAAALEWLSPDDVDNQMTLLQESVRLAPGWVKNRRILAQYYFIAGRPEDAVRQLQRALENRDGAAPPATLVEEYFHVNVTGLTDDREAIEAELREGVGRL